MAINYHMLTKPVDHETFLTELLAAGVTVGISIGSDRVTLSGPAWLAMTPAQQTSQLALVASTETAHVAATITEVTLTSAPHPKKLAEELLAVVGVTDVSVFQADSYPGVVRIMHNTLTPTEQSNLSAAALAHDASAVPVLTVDTSSQVIAADGVATGTVTVTDSRGVAASGNTVRLRIPPGGSAGASADSFVLDAAGQATVTFQATTTLTGELTFEFYYDSDEADPVLFTVRRGT